MSTVRDEETCDTVLSLGVAVYATRLSLFCFLTITTSNPKYAFLFGVWPIALNLLGSKRPETYIPSWSSSCRNC